MIPVRGRNNAHFLLLLLWETNKLYILKGEVIMKNNERDIFFDVENWTVVDMKAAQKEEKEGKKT